MEHFAQAVEIGLRRARPFRCHEALGAHHRLRLAQFRDQPDVGQLGRAVHEDDVGRLDVAVDQAVSMQVLQRVGQRQAHAQALGVRQPVLTLDFALEGFGNVAFRVQGSRLKIQPKRSSWRGWPTGQELGTVGDAFTDRCRLGSPSG